LLKIPFVEFFQVLELFRIEEVLVVYEIANNVINVVDKVLEDTDFCL
jgi:hypothetical protein